MLFAVSMDCSLGADYPPVGFVPRGAPHKARGTTTIPFFHLTYFFVFWRPLTQGCPCFFLGAFGWVQSADVVRLQVGIKRLMSMTVKPRYLRHSNRFCLHTTLLITGFFSITKCNVQRRPVSLASDIPQPSVNNDSLRIPHSCLNDRCMACLPSTGRRGKVIVSHLTRWRTRGTFSRALPVRREGVASVFPLAGDVTTRTTKNSFCSLSPIVRSVLSRSVSTGLVICAHLLRANRGAVSGS